MAASVPAGELGGSDASVTREAASTTSSNGVAGEGKAKTPPPRPPMPKAKPRAKPPMKHSLSEPGPPGGKRASPARPPPPSRAYISQTASKKSQSCENSSLFRVIDSRVSKEQHLLSPTDHKQASPERRPVSPSPPERRPVSPSPLERRPASPFPSALQKAKPCISEAVQQMIPAVSKNTEKPNNKVSEVTLRSASPQQPEYKAMKKVVQRQSYGYWLRQKISGVLNTSKSDKHKSVPDMTSISPDDGHNTINPYAVVPNNSPGILFSEIYEDLDTESWDPYSYVAFDEKPRYVPGSQRETSSEDIYSYPLETPDGYIWTSHKLHKQRSLECLLQSSSQSLPVGTSRKSRRGSDGHYTSLVSAPSMSIYQALDLASNRKP